MHLPAADGAARGRAGCRALPVGEAPVDFT